MYRFCSVHTCELQALLGQAPSSKDECLRLVLLDDHLLFRESLARLLAAEEDFKIVAQCANSREATETLKTSDVHVVLVDLDIAKGFIDVARRISYGGKFLVVARTVDATEAASVLKYGASGIFLESESANRLMQAIRLVAKGEVWIDQRTIQLLADRYPQHEVRLLENLSDREHAVLNAVVEGLSNRKISDQIGISESAVKGTLQLLFGKTGVRTRSQLVRIVLEGLHAGESGTRT